MDLKHKHWAIIIVAGLVALFIAIIVWYFFSHTTVVAPVVEQVATTTPLVSTTTPPQHLLEHAAYYDIDLTYPAHTPLTALSPEADAAAVASMKQFAEDRAAEFKVNGNFANLSHDDVILQGLDQRKEALTSEYDVYTGPRTVSYVFQIYEDTLGAHPNLYFKTYTFDTRTGEKVALSSLFQPNFPYLERLSARVNTDLPHIIMEKSGYEGDPTMITDGTSPAEENFQWFYIDAKNLVIVFPPYQVGPYALGTVTDPIPLNQLSDGLNAEYLP